MVDPSPQAGADSPTRSDICEQVGRAVGSLWQRRSGVRPASVRTEYVGDVVRCTIEEGEAPSDSEQDAAPEPRAPLDGRAYESEAQAAVRRLTGRTVMGFVSRPVKHSSAVTNAFILQKVHTRY